MSDKINPCGVCGADHLAVTLGCPPLSKEYKRGFADAIEMAARAALGNDRSLWATHALRLDIADAIRVLDAARSKEAK